MNVLFLINRFDEDGKVADQCGRVTKNFPSEMLPSQGDYLNVAANYSERSPVVRRRTCMFFSANLPYGADWVIEAKTDSPNLIGDLVGVSGWNRFKSVVSL